MATSKIDDLKRVPIFARVSRAELESLARNTDEIDFPAGKTLITQGRSNDTFFVLLQGQVEVAVDGKVISHLGPGDVFGEISMLDRGPATATVTTTAPSVFLVMSHAQFRDAVKAHEDLALRVIAVMAERLRGTERAGIS
ncbi:MAG TPA: cyclic nucleotide-binding domain-containing protein [Chloroflexota bacterium]|nr:cyclic nucleotide-binding domain-containing protein [Chloroflexota bacterium]